jgi:hypothetical protein
MGPVLLGFAAGILFSAGFAALVAALRWARRWTVFTPPRGELRCRMAQRRNPWASVLVRAYVEARIAAPVKVGSTPEPRPRGRRRAVPPGGAS